MTMALTGKGQILGTLQYMSPEQVNGQEAGAQSDIFSFGLVLYEGLLAGALLKARRRRVSSRRSWSARRLQSRMSRPRLWTAC